MPALAENVITFLPGARRVNTGPLESVAREFGWVVDRATDLREIAALRKWRRPVALFVFRDALGPDYSWLEAIRLLRLTLPDVRLIACHEFSEAVDWPALCDAGAFHEIHLPLQENELHQCLGFVWEAEKRLVESEASDLRLPAASRRLELLALPA